MIKSPIFAIFEDRKWNSLKIKHVINDVEMRTRVSQTEKENKWVMDSDDSHSFSSSLSSSCESIDNEITLADCEGTQPYLFEPYDSEASSGTDSNESSEEETFDRLQNTDW